uniref:ETS domain-containing protein n=1 Tax=Octopus bimaculoides TaxID=37653 RepID=A0A0L8HME9_OCTBM
MKTWQYKHPKHWSRSEVLDWIFWSIENENLDASRMRGEAFQNIDGVQLCEMTVEKFLQKEPNYGAILFQILSSLIHKLKNQLLWEFLYDALKNPGYNPRFLKWENEVEGIFRFVQSEMMANVWGELKNNENMNYEKLSRAMRHYYRRGILERVEGRRLVYKFSRNAIEKLKLRSK